jgi:hypothetical protein
MLRHARDLLRNTPQKKLVCPYCDKQEDHKISENWNELICTHCKKNFRCLLASVRAKRSKGDKRRFIRQTAIRIIYSNKEDVIEYKCKYNEDLELRSGDLAIFIFKQNKDLSIVQNLTLNKYLRLKRIETDVDPVSAFVVIFLFVLGFFIVLITR